MIRTMPNLVEFAKAIGITGLTHSADAQLPDMLAEEHRQRICKERGINVR